MNRLIKHIVVLVFVCTVNILPQSLSLVNYTSNDILPANSVWDLLQDSKGYIWIATEVGLSKFDGHSIKNYSTKDGLPSNQIFKIFEDSSGKIWIGTDRGIAFFSQGRFTSVDFEMLNNQYVYDIIQTQSGSILFSTKNNGIVEFKGGVFSKKKIENENDLKSVSSLFIDSNDNLWVGTFNNGIFIVDKVGNSKSINSQLNTAITDIIEDPNGNILVATAAGFYSYNQEVDSLKSSNLALSNIYIHNLFIDRYETLWIATDNKGLYTIIDGKLKNYNIKNGLPSDQLKVITEDTRGDIWFGFFNGGLSRLPAERFEILNSKNLLPNDLVYAIGQDTTGASLFGHYGYGVSIVSNESAKILNTKNGLISNFVASIFTDSQGRIWIGTDKGVSLYNGKSIKNFTKENGLKDNLVTSIFEDSKNNIWFGTSEGVSKFENDSIISFGSNENVPEDWINDIYMDKTGSIWFATWDSGLILYNGKSFENISTENGLPSNRVWSITRDDEYNVWLGLDIGICKYDGENFTLFSERNGLPAKDCVSIIYHDFQLFIGTTQNGIIKFNYTEFEEKGKHAFKVYNSKNGLPSNELNLGASFIDNEKNLWFGGPKGVIKINPRNIPKPSSASIYLDNIKIIDEDTEIDTLPKNSLNLKYFQNNINVYFDGVWFDQSTDLEFQLMMEPIDKSWSQINERSVNYRSLPSGDYKFNVRCLNNDGYFSDNIASFSFTINPPFWYTWWFLTLLILFAFSAIIAIYIFKTEQVRKRNIELERLVRIRTKELAKEKDKSDELLHNILPASLVEELKKNGFVKPRYFKSVSIMFLDFEGFTTTSSLLPADELVKELNDIFRGFDSIVGNCGLEKLKTIGDSYMAAAGLPVESEDHSIRIVYAAFKMREYIYERNKSSDIIWKMRIGIHTGDVVAGVVGTKKFTYDVWGDTVNIASRMESYGLSGEINVSANTFNLIKNYYNCESRGKIDVKGKGNLDMYLVKEFKKDLTELLFSKNKSQEEKIKQQS